VGDAIELPAEATSVRAARRYCRARLETLDAGELADPVVLLVSELVTNVVQHARTPCSVSVRSVGAGPGRAVRVEILDADPRLPAEREVDVDAGSGRGLLLVRKLSSRHGWERRGGGKLVWFEVDLAGGARSA